MKLLSVAQINQIDRLSSKQYGISRLVLMENAGFQLFRQLEKHFQQSLQKQRVVIFSGAGKNGGDGLVLARMLDQNGINTTVYLLEPKSKYKEESLANLKAWLKSGHKAKEINDENWSQIAPTLGIHTVVIDALLGTGLSRPLTGLYATVVEELNRGNWFRMAVDIPSGMNADSVETPILCFQANLTVTFTAPKIAHFLNPSQESLGIIRVAPIGCPRKLLDSKKLKLSVITSTHARKALPPRLTDSHKGTYGKIAIVAGSRGKAGAAVLTSWATLRTGAGLVTCFTSNSAESVVAKSHPEIMTEALSETKKGAISVKNLSSTLRRISTFDTVGLGPGLGLAKETIFFVNKILSCVDLPIILDADGINALQGDPEKLQSSIKRPIILTPHPREFSRLLGVPVLEVRKNRLKIAARFSKEHQLWLVLKDYRTLIASPEGDTLVCPTGNAGMATAGSGDVLTGIISSFIGSYWASGKRTNTDITKGLAAAVYIHGLAGDAASLSVSMNSLTATSIIDFLEQGFSELENIII